MSGSPSKRAVLSAGVLAPGPPHAKNVETIARKAHLCIAGERTTGEDPRAEPLRSGYSLWVSRPLVDVEGLRSKYLEILAMRLDFDAGERDEFVARRRMRELAAVFPGALRELDDLELSEIRRRIGALDAVLSKEREVESWMEATHLFHVLARGAICAKRWLRGRKSEAVDARTQRDFSEALASLAFPEDANLWREDLRCVASPPRGRITQLVFVRIARLLGLTADEARRLVFGPPRRERAKRMQR